MTEAEETTDEATADPADSAGTDASAEPDNSAELDTSDTKAVDDTEAADTELSDAATAADTTRKAAPKKAVPKKAAPKKAMAKKTAAKKIDSSSAEERADASAAETNSGGQRVLWGAISAIGVLLAGTITLSALCLIGWAIDHPAGAGAGSAIQVALQSWYLAHGVALPVSWGTLSIPPLLVSLAIGVFFYRSGRGTARSLGIRSWAHIGETVAAYAVTYVTLSVILTSFAFPTGGIGLTQVILSALGFAALPTLLGMMVETGVATVSLRSIPGPSYAYGAGLRAGALGAVGVSALLVGASLVVNFSEASALVAALAPGGVAGLSIIGISVMYLPNAMVMAMTLGSGAGFSVGAQTSVSLGSVERGSLPAFPLLAAIPHGWSPLVWTAVLIPVVATSFAALAMVRRLEAEDRTIGSLLAVAGGFAAVSAVVVAALAGLSGGALGSDNLATVGAPWFSAGIHQLVLGFVVGAAVMLIGSRGEIRSAPAVRRSKVIAAAKEDRAGSSPADLADDGTFGAEATDESEDDATHGARSRLVAPRPVITTKRGLRRLTRSAPKPTAGGASAPSATLSIVQRARAEREAEAARRVGDELHAADPDTADELTVDLASDEARATQDSERKAG